MSVPEHVTETTETFVELPCDYSLCPVCEHDTALVCYNSLASVGYYTCLKCSASDYRDAEVREL